MLIKKILYIINLLFALLLGLTYLPAFLPQDIFARISLLGYCYPFLLVINLLFVILWLFIKPRHVLLSLFFILIRIDYIPRLVNFTSSDNNPQIKILTYNVHDFIHKIDNYDSQLIAAQQDSVTKYIASTNADILCFQDYNVNTKWQRGFHRYLIDSLGYNNFYYYNVHRSVVRDCAIYSKYPIKDAGSILPDHERNYQYIYADIKTPGQTLRVYNIHLASYMLGPQEQSDYKNIFKGQVSDSASRNIVRKLVDANIKRAKQIRRILPVVEDNPKPVIIAGDFNDHPFSNTYKKFSNQYSDSFVAKGKGLGRTYNGVFPAYRIDYVWYKKSRITVTDYSSPALDFSDHYPVLVTFNIKQE